MRLLFCVFYHKLLKYQCGESHQTGHRSHGRLRPVEGGVLVDVIGSLFHIDIIYSLVFCLNKDTHGAHLVGRFLFDCSWEVFCCIEGGVGG